MAQTQNQADIVQQLDAIINANRGEVMFVETKFSTDFEAETVLSFDVDSNEWLVNRWHVRAGGKIELECMPLMSFPEGAL